MVRILSQLMIKVYLVKGQQERQKHQKIFFRQDLSLVPFHLKAARCRQLSAI